MKNFSDRINAMIHSFGSPKMRQELHDIERKMDSISKKLAGVQLWENGPYWAECNLGAENPEECGHYFQ